jgi:hypothetical protein
MTKSKKWNRVVMPPLSKGKYISLPDNHFSKKGIYVKGNYSPGRRR